MIYDMFKIPKRFIAQFDLTPSYYHVNTEPFSFLKSFVSNTSQEISIVGINEIFQASNLTLFTPTILMPFPFEGFASSKTSLT